MKKTLLMTMVLLLTMTTAVAQKYRVANVSRQRLVIDSRYADDKKGTAMLAPYKQQVDSVMSPVVGRTVKYMKAYAPESELGNLLSDILVWCGEQYGEKPDLGIYNLGGIRAALPKGEITFGDIVNVAPFENKIIFFSLTGQQLQEFFEQGAKNHGACISRGIQATVRGREIVKVTINGEPIDPNRNYRIATIDYLAQGNDGLPVLGKGFDINAPKDDNANTRYLITQYFLEKYAKGEAVDAQIEGRVIMEK